MVSGAMRAGSIPAGGTNRQTWNCSLFFLIVVVRFQISYQSILIDVIVSDPPTALSLKIFTSSFLSFKAREYNKGK